jgi:hypothetical protein
MSDTTPPRALGAAVELDLPVRRDGKMRQGVRAPVLDTTDSHLAFVKVVQKPFAIDHSHSSSCNQLQLITPCPDINYLQKEANPVEFPQRTSVEE